MDFDAGDTERECIEGVGDPNSIQEETRECRTVTPGENLCIFPFYWEGKYYDRCAMLEHDGFLIRVFRCPIYNTVNKINGTNSYTYADLIQQVRQTFGINDTILFNNSSQNLMMQHTEQ